MSSVINLLCILLYSRSLQFSAFYLQGATEGALDPLPCVYYHFTLLRHFRAPLRARRFLECPCCVFQFSSYFALCGWLNIRRFAPPAITICRISVSLLFKGFWTVNLFSTLYPVDFVLLSFCDYIITHHFWFVNSFFDTLYICTKQPHHFCCG